MNLLHEVLNHSKVSAPLLIDGIRIESLDHDVERAIGIVCEKSPTKIASAFLDHGLSVVTTSTESTEVFREAVAKQALVIFEDTTVARAIKLRECLHGDALGIPRIAIVRNPSPIDEVLLLELGFDDVISSSVEARVVVARAKASLRRHAASAGHPIPRGSSTIIGRLHIDFIDRIVRVDGKSVDLTASEYDALLLLARNVGQIVSRDEITQKLTGRPPKEFSRMVDCRISRLRKKLCGDSRGLQQIRCIRNEGYLLVGAINHPN